MSKYVDLELINSRSREREQLVQDGKYIETIESEGRSPDSIKKKAKDILGLGEDGIIALEANSIMMTQNVKTKAFVSLVNFISKAEESDLLNESDLSSVCSLRDSLAKDICEVYQVDIEDLYIGDENE